MRKAALLCLSLVCFGFVIQAGPQQPAGDDQRVLHVLNRLGFAPRPGDVDRVKRMGVEKYIEQQLHPESINDKAMDGRLDQFVTLKMSVTELAENSPDKQKVAKQLGLNPKKTENPADQAAMRKQVQEYMRKEGLMQPQRIAQELMAQKIVRGVYSERQLQEVLADFWFNHFNVFLGKGDKERYLTTDYEMGAIRPHVLGKFKDLLMATAKSPAMLVYLDNAVSTAPDPRLVAALDKGGNNNRKRKPGINENYARELMELHTMGVDGGYTQQDVQEVARAFTGWSVAQDNNQLPQLERQAIRLGMKLPESTSGEPGSFVFRAAMHDSGEKRVLGNTIKAGGGMEDGERVIDILAHHPSTARFISTKLVRRFVSDTPPESLIDRVAAVYTKTDGDIREMLRAIFSSREFLAPDAWQAKTKSPFEFVVSAIRSLDGTTDGGQQLIQMIERMGQPLYRYQPPTGFPDRASFWMTDGSIVERLNFAVGLTSNRIPGTRVQLAGFKDAKAAAVYIGSPEFQKR